MIANATKLDAELRAAEIPIAGCDSKGGVQFTAAATDADKARAAEILAAHDPSPSRAELLAKAGISEREAAFALVHVHGAMAPAWALAVVEGLALKAAVAIAEAPDPK